MVRPFDGCEDWCELPFDHLGNECASFDSLLHDLECALEDDHSGRCDTREYSELNVVHCDGIIGESLHINDHLVSIDIDDRHTESFIKGTLKGFKIQPKKKA